nr:hypothetical protein [uncultured bacterium]
MRISAALFLSIGLSIQLQAQSGEPPRFAQSIPIPTGRAEDSYAIHSQLLTGGPIEWRDAKRRQWLINDTARALPLDQACDPGSKDEPTRMNPHRSVVAPEERQTEWNEVLADFDEHCHDVVRLDRSSFKTKLPIHLLDADDQKRFRENPLGPPEGFADGAGLHSFSEVFFNRTHTLALVSQSMWCGMLCASWTWVALERREGHWEQLPWVRTSVIS